MTPTRWRTLAFLSLAVLIVFAAALFLPSDVRQRLASLGLADLAGTHAPPGKSTDAMAPRGARTEPPATADRGAERADGAKRGAESNGEAARRSPIETLPEGGSAEAAKPGGSAPPPSEGERPTTRAETPARPDGAQAERETGLDIVRIEPNGDSVIAGRTRPNASVELLRDNAPFARVTADPSGNFAVVPPPLPVGSSEIRYRAVAPDGQEIQGKESVAVVIADNRTTKPLVALSTPDKPTEVLSRPEAAAPVAERAKPAAPQRQAATSPGTSSRPEAGPAPTTEARRSAEPDGRAASTPGTPSRSGDAPQPEKASPRALATLPSPPPKPDASARPIQIVSIDAQEGGRLDVVVAGTPGATLRLYLNDTMVAAGQVASDGKLAITIGRGVRAGGYEVRVDQVEAGTGKVARRAQVAFTFPDAAAGPSRSAQNAPQAAPPSGSTGTPKPERQTAPAKDPVVAAREAGTPDASSRARAELPATPKAPSPAAENGARVPTDGTRAAGASEPQRDESATRLAGRAEAPPPPQQPTTSTPSSQPQAGSGPTDPSPPPATERRTDTAIAPTPGGRPGEPASPDRPGTLAREGSAPTAGASADPAQMGQAGTVFVPEIATARITRGDNLWQISRRSYGSGVRYTVIFDANKDQIRDPNLIYPGQIFVLPRDEAAGGKRG